MFFLLYKHTDGGVFDDFPKISDHFPKISEDSPKLFRRPDERSRTFSNKIPKTPEDVRRFPKIAEDFRGRPEDVSMILQRIQVQFKRQTWYHRNHRYLHMWRYHISTCEDIVSFLSICYHSLYHWLLYNKLNYCILRLTSSCSNQSSVKPRIILTWGCIIGVRLNQTFT